MNTAIRYFERYFYYEIICLYIILVSAIGIISLSIECFNVLIIAIISIALTALIYFSLPRNSNSIAKTRFNLSLLIVLAIAFILRLGPYPHHVGGQDQGLYVNMSRCIDRYGSLTITDHFRESLTKQEKELYDANGGSLAGGVEPVDMGSSKVQMPFYPLHPMWMAIFAKLFGVENGVYSLTFFSLLSIVGIYFLAREISNNQAVASLAAFLASLNPGLVFFSKFPVTEIVALAFTTNGFYFLSRGYHSLKKGNAFILDMIISAGFFNCFYYTRMSAFLYIPIFSLLCIVSLIDLENRQQRVKLIYYYAALAVLFSSSVLFYYLVMPKLFYPIAGMLISPLGTHWLIILISMAICFLIITAYFVKYLQVPQCREVTLKIFKKISIFFLYSIIASLFIALIPALQIIFEGYTSSIHNFVVKPGWGAAIYSGLYHIMLYLSPIGFVLLFLSPFSKSIKKNNNAILLIIFVAIMIVITTLNKFYKYVLYSFYYDRYYISEIIPFSLIVISLIILPNNNKYIIKRVTCILCILFITIYFLFFSFAQLGKIEGSYPDFFYEIQNKVGSEDLIFLEYDQFPRPNHIKTPLIFYFNKKIFPINNTTDLSNPLIDGLKKRYNKVYLLSAKKYFKVFDLDQSLIYKEGFFVSGFHVWNYDPRTQPFYIKALLPFMHYTLGRIVYLYRMI